MEQQPASYLTVALGTDVVSSEGERVGTLEHVLADADADIFDGIVIDTGHGRDGLRFADAADVAEIHEQRVVLSIPTQEVEQLHRPGPNPAVIESHGVEDAESPLEHKLRRAWEIVSGKG